MTEDTRISLRVGEDVPEKLSELAGGVKKMGDYLTTLVRQIHAGQATVGEPGDLDLVTAGFKHLSAKVKELEARLQQVEQRG